MVSFGFKFFFGYGMCAIVVSRATPRVWTVSADRLLSGLDQQQRRAVEIDAHPLAIVATAGSGKTTVLTRRIAFRIARGDADARHVLALTFTREAASELRRRLRRLDIDEPIEAGTFHSVALRLLRDRAMTRNESAPVVASDRLRLLKEVLTEVRLDTEPFLALVDVDWARARRIAPEDYERETRATRRRSAIPPQRFTEVVAAYTRLKRRRGVMDFDDMLELNLRAIETDKAFRDLVRWRFRHFFVDEAQDLNPLQHELLEAWRGGRPDICLVGDPRQAIYGWNGADHTTLTEVERAYPGVTVVSLTTNHRSSPQVISAASAALSANGMDDDTASSKPDGPALQVHRCTDPEAEARAIATWVRDASHTHGLSSIAVLTRTNEQLVAIDRALNAVGISSERAVGRSPLERTLAEVYRLRNRESLAVWADENLTHEDELRRRVASEIDRFLASAEAGTLRGWVDARDPFDDLEDQHPHGAVSLLTFHAAKGREWQVVFLAGAEDRLIPHSSSVSAPARAEEARLLYVAITRAIERLTITWCETRDGRASAPSPWLDAVMQTIADDRPVPPPTPRPVRPPDPFVALQQWRAQIARGAGLS
jgi:DNA helicase-2/ATP-dependent DNA helicase PcrA